MRALVISERAEADLREIWRYSFKEWGEEQADRYLDELDQGLQECSSGVVRQRLVHGAVMAAWPA
jgi:toxin ParE1/3/4